MINAEVRKMTDYDVYTYAELQLRHWRARGFNFEDEETVRCSLATWIDIGLKHGFTVHEAYPAFEKALAKIREENALRKQNRNP